MIQSDYCAWCKLVFQLRARKINHRISYDSPLNDSSFISDVFPYRFIQMLFWRLLVNVSIFTTGHIHILKTTVYAVVNCNLSGGQPKSLFCQLKFCAVRHKSRDILCLRNGLSLFVTYEWLTLSLFLSTRTSYLKRRLKKLRLKFYASVHQSESFVLDND